MSSFSFKVTYSVMLAGFFIIASMVAVSYQSLTVTSCIIFGLLALYVFLLSFALGQRFSTPVKSLLKRADDLSKGDSSSKVDVQSKDEFGELAKTFNIIGENFERNKAEVERIEKSSDIKLKTNTLLLERVVDALETKVKNRTMEMQKAMEDAQKFQTQLQDKETQMAILKSQLAQLQEKTVKKPRAKKKIA